jgi:hypothetical protein
MHSAKWKINVSITYSSENAILYTYIDKHLFNTFGKLPLNTGLSDPYTWLLFYQANQWVTQAAWLDSTTVFCPKATSPKLVSVNSLERSSYLVGVLLWGYQCSLSSQTC